MLEVLISMKFWRTVAFCISSRVIAFGTECYVIKFMCSSARHCSQEEGCVNWIGWRDIKSAGLDTPGSYFSSKLQFCSLSIYRSIRIRGLEGGLLKNGITSLWSVKVLFTQIEEIKQKAPYESKCFSFSLTVSLFYSGQRMSAID